MGTVEDPVLLGHPAGVPVVDPFSDQIVVPAEALPLVLAGTEGLQVAVLVVRIQAHPVGDPGVVPLGAQSLVRREDPAGVVVPLGN